MEGEIDKLEETLTPLPLFALTIPNILPFERYWGSAVRKGD
jgi:hypothetical protein